MDPSDSYFLFVDFVDFYTHLTSILIFGHKFHIGMPYCRKRFWTRQIPTSCLPTYLVFIHIEHICTFISATIDGRDLIFGHKLHIGTPYRGKRFWIHQIPTSCLPTLLIFMHIEHAFCICPFLVTFFSATIDGRNLIFGHKLHIGIEHAFCICPFLVTFFSATIDGRNLIFGHKLHIGTPYRGKRFLTRQIPTSCLPKSGGIISEH